jgi:hypothetical protein
MRRFERHQQGETKWDKAVFTESAVVKVRLHLATSEHAIAPYRAILGTNSLRYAIYPSTYTEGNNPLFEVLNTQRFRATMRAHLALTQIALRTLVSASVPANI